MATTFSPLRYPGGKGSLQNQVAELLVINDLQLGDYAEPYAGGCGLALSMLYRGYVSDIHINDIDAGIWSFWHSILTDTDAFIERMNRTPVTIEQWHREVELLNSGTDADSLTIGFATFFLNRTNRSGIIRRAGVIGGLEQNGNYKIDCRFNKPDLERRIRRVASYADRIHLHRMDAVAFLDHVQNDLPEDTFCYIDPPYYNKGSSLYTSFYEPDDHETVATRVLQLTNPWIITYDHTPEIQALYRARRQFEFSLQYSVQEKRLGSELLIASKGLRLPPVFKDNQIHQPRSQAA